MTQSDSPFPRRRAPLPVEECGAALASRLLSDRWTLLIVREGFYGVTRFDDMRADLGIPRSVLADRLDKLVEAGVFARQPYREEGARTRQAYVLTRAGWKLSLTVLALMQWGDEHLRGGKSSLDVTEKGTGKPLRVALVRDGDDFVRLSQVDYMPRNTGETGK
ncbi:hypothetical protein ACMU_17200 [Actibacterium mucosum KCTC 23349]|uniref:HTH hxlR-type domain-containing protein n=1 Tax=Actibacterium mucosum KCTC 23349 TaxID=1454373 RepID=A0A037ZI37_9RHOB|nr:helix-turn-helix domain-containing protein [Actibacterium mucosum]KAJ54450.1 hypothetical protein ACMU_17200 [Actibacterium mucosum KCTC 23349]